MVGMISKIVAFVQEAWQLVKKLNFSIFPIFVIFLIFGSKMGFLGLGRGLKSFVEVLRFVVTEYRGVWSHGDPIRDQVMIFETSVEDLATSEKHLGLPRCPEPCQLTKVVSVSNGMQKFYFFSKKLMGF